MSQKHVDVSALQAALERHERTIALLEQRISQLEALIRASVSGPVASGTTIDETAKEEPIAYKIESTDTESQKVLYASIPTFTMRRMEHDGYTYNDLDIENPELVQLLKHEIGYKYPGVNVGGNMIYMQSPFPAIIHNWDRLQMAASREPNGQVCKDLRLLLGQISTCEELVDYFKTREADLAAKVTSFDMAWTLFAPGTLIVTNPFMDVPQLLQVAEAPVPWAPASLKNASRLYTLAWCWDWNGRRMVKVKYRLTMRRFRGTKAIDEMEYYPLSYHHAPTALREMIRNRSQKFLLATLFCKTVSDQRFMYDGHAYVRGRKVLTATPVNEGEDSDSRDNGDVTEAKLTRIGGEIMCDARSYLEYGSKSSHTIGGMEHDSVEVPVSELEDVFANLSLNDIGHGSHNAHEGIILLPGRLLGYAMREKLWGQFSVELVRPPMGKEPNLFRTHLQLEHTYKNLIEASFASHEATLAHRAHDIVRGQGQGLVLLLHGPSGVGKTLTAEAIALATGKVLFAISVAEIGLEASRAESNLEKLFHLATRWEAVLLVNEADVLLETRRPTTDASRNALTSVFLRALEYYQGTIILTTNRVKISIDQAIISRVHLAIPYRHLGDSQTHAIFRYFLDRLEPDMIKDRRRIDEFIGDTGHHYGLNGRQIRNILSLAVALARQEAVLGQGDGRLTEAHIRQLCKMTREFQERLGDHPLAQRHNDELAGFGGHSGY